MSRSNNTHQGMNAVEVAEFSVFVLTRMSDIRPDQIAHFGNEMGLTAEQIQDAFNLAACNEEIDPDEPLQIEFPDKRR